MSKIVNEYVKGDEIVEAVRSAIEFRATWMGLIFDEMRKSVFLRLYIFIDYSLLWRFFRYVCSRANACLRLSWIWRR